mmetsp:Transcript_13338/g.26365  ORF Transcript_13338/g.26365 Transcript_13338/m.26365 type:complete len:117 (+) Transcript_13338:742-1092(+)
MSELQSLKAEETEKKGEGRKRKEHRPAWSSQTRAMPRPDQENMQGVCEKTVGERQGRQLWIERVIGRAVGRKEVGRGRRWSQKITGCLRWPPFFADHKDSCLDILKQKLEPCRIDR